MRRSLLSILCLLLAPCLLLAGCKSKTAPEAPADDTAPTGEAQADSTYKLTEHYLPETVVTAMETAIREEPTSAFTAAETNLSYYVIDDVFALSNCRVKSITFPVYRTGKADSGGNFVFTIVVGGNTRESMMQSEKPDRVYHLSLNGEEYGLTASSNELRLVTVDLTPYEIVLKEGETMGFLDPADTIIPAMIPMSASVFATFFHQNVEACATFMRAYIGKTWSKANTEDNGLTQKILPFDFELERTWESKEAHDAEVAAAEAAEAEYQRKLAAVREHYRGKKLSLIGDSITTYSSVSDNAAINSTLAPHESSYRPDALYPDHTKTYWGIVQTLLEMDLCVVNAWGGSRTYGSESKSWIDNMPRRAVQLHTDGGVYPDLIIVYMGTNDVKNSPTGDLPTILAAADDKQATFATWYAGVLTTAATTGDDLIPGTTWTDWFAAYALGIKRMKETYPSAEIYCMTLMENYHSAGNVKARVDQTDLCIRTIAEYFGAKLIDQQKNGYITKANCILYGKDTGAESLHPNLRGHKMMARCTIEELYRGLLAD